MKTLNILLLCTFIVLNSCKPDEPEPIPQDPPQLTTSEAKDITARDVILGGDISSLGSGDVYTRGVCWSLNTNPTTRDNFKDADGSGLGSFFIKIEHLDPNTTYNVRAYAENEYGSSYGNNISFTTTELMTFTTEIARRILASRVTLKATVSGEITTAQKGFVLDTSPNPTTNHLKLQDGFGTGIINIFAENLSPATVYYARPYSSAGSAGPLYGEEISFKTAGYLGPAGGYVFFDKGEETDGWRYFEFATQMFSDKQWGCDGTLISNTSTQEGQGLSNTSKITAKCLATNYPAKICSSYEQNGFNDWFLASKDEGINLMRGLYEIIQNPPNYIWTSSEVASTVAIQLYIHNGYNIVPASITKRSYNTVVPIRRY